MKRMTLAFGLLAGGFGATAGAVTVNFDTLQADILVGNEFLGVGARFVGSFQVTETTFGGAVIIPSPPNYIQLGGTSTVEFVDPAHPEAPATTGSISVVSPGLNFGCYNGIRIDAFDVSGLLLDSVTIPAATGTVSQSTTTLNAVDIATLDMTNLGGNCITIFDNLGFDTVVPVGIFADSFESPATSGAASD